MTRNAIASFVVTFTLTATSAASFVVAQESERPRRFGRRRPQVTSPEVSPDRRVTFRLLAPEAESVRLGGNDIPEVGRGMDMKKGDEGVWEVTLGPVGPGAYRYRFHVDGVPVIDPRNPSTSESTESTWSLVYIPGSDLLDTRDVPHGAVAEVIYYSRLLKRFRRMHVYTPPGYETGTAEYPIFYLLHGAFDCDDSWTTVGRAGFILDNLIAAGKAKPVVVVMPDGHTGPFRFGRPGGLRMEEFVDDFVEDLMPHAERRYRVLTDRKHRAIAGLSMGGAQTLDLAISDLEKFGYVGVFSSGVFGIDRQSRDGGPGWEERHAKALDDGELKKGLELVWFATGREDFLLDTSRRTADMLEAHGFDVEFHETDGGHTWINWREYLGEFATLLFQEGRATGSSEERENDGFETIFDGEDLDGWRVVPEERSGDWTVRDGVIRAAGTEGTSYLVWKDDGIEDFELELAYRMLTEGNTGVEIRARPDTSGKRLFEAYHADLGHVGIGPHILGAWDMHFAKRTEYPTTRVPRRMIAPEILVVVASPSSPMTPPLIQSLMS